MMNKTKYVAIAVLLLAICSAGTYANVYWYNITPCDAIDISLTDDRVIEFLDRTNMATVDVYNCKTYKGYNTWLVNWHTKTRSQRVYIDIYSGDIVGTGPTPGPCWHTVTTIRGRNEKDAVVTVKGDMWRINWETTCIENNSSIYVGIYETTGFMMEVDSFAQDVFPFNSGTYEVYEGAGSYVINVYPTNLESWKLEIEDYF